MTVTSHAPTGPAAMHTPDPHLVDTVLAYLRERLLMPEAELDGPAPPEQLAATLDGLLTEQGRPVEDVLELFVHRIAPTVISADSPRYLAFIPAAPTRASLVFDAVVSASSMSGVSWLEAAGAVAAENQVLRWLSDLFGLPAGAGGTFVSGGSAGNLNGLAVARETARRRLGDPRARVRVAVSEEAHSSVAKALLLLDLEALAVPTEDHRLTGEGLRAALAADDARLASDPSPGPVVAVVATAGTTNAGIVDDLSGVGAVTAERELWLHVDAAYGGAAVLSPTDGHRFAGIEHADSIVTDPHKWWFAPLDCAALLWRRPALAQAIMTQDASYLDVLHTDDTPVRNPSDLAYHLSRRARGLPLWFSLAVHGLGAYREAVQAAIDLTNRTARRLAALPTVELVRPPSLSVVLWRRVGWGPEDYQRLQDELLTEQVALVTPTRWQGETVGRFSFLHPGTTDAMVDEILRRLA
ncbi:MAG: pyridoxal phosphate-dependent decarboxylase family protein [Kineosporiaceae bacterium]